MDLLHGLYIGFGTALSWDNLAYCFVGVLLGTWIGVLPGLGPIATIAMLLPLTYSMPAVPAIIMLAGIYYGAQYGGSTTAILINLPGEPSSIVTSIDGHQMARKGRAGVALATAAIGSFVAGCIATLLLALFSPPLASIALDFGPSEYFALMTLGLIFSATLASGDFVKGVAMIVFGLLLGLIGEDIFGGMPRMTFGVDNLIDGLDFAALAMGMFGLGEVINNLDSEVPREFLAAKIDRLMPNRDDFRRMLAPILRGTAVGSLLGILPGGGATLSSFVSYTVEKKWSRYPEEFGKGAIEAVAGPESANNAGAQMSFVPMLTLGIPSNPVTALLIGALLIQGLTPGPNIVTNQPVLFWGVIASMWIGNLMLVILNLPLVGIWVRFVRIPYYLMYPGIVIICIIGVYSLRNNPFDIYVMTVFGAVGYLLTRLDCEPAPFLLGFVLGPMLEVNLKRAMLLAHGNVMAMVARPITGVLLLVAVGLIVAQIIPAVGRYRRKALAE